MKHVLRFFTLALCFSLPYLSLAQSVGISGTAIVPDADALLELRTTDKGVLLPRMDATQRGSYTSAANAGAGLGAFDKGMTIFNTTSNMYNYWDGAAWIEMSTSGSVLGLSLDDAYDAGGSGSGRSITADAGAVEILGSGGLYVNANVGIGTNSPQQLLEVIGNISLPSSSGNKQIYTWSPTDANWRIGMSATPGFTRSLATSHVEYRTFASSPGQGFAVGDNVSGLSAFEVTGSGSGYDAFFRGDVGIGGNPTYPLHVTKTLGGNWQGRFTNGNSNVYLAHQGGYGMHINTGGTNSSSRYALEVRNSSQVHMYVRDDGRVGIRNSAPGYELDVTGNTRTTGDFFGDIHVDDTRSVNSPPTTYNNEVAFDFKNRGTVGAPGSGAYSGMMTIAPWGDNSGDASHQINFNEGGLFWRQGQPDNATWGSWDQIMTASVVDGFVTHDNLGNHIATTGIKRNNHNVGHLEGSYNNVGANSARSNPIYTIGSNYNPTTTALSNMYGIGYAHGNFWGSGGNRPTGWGMYAASDGDIRVILDAQNGVVWSEGVMSSNGGYVVDGLTVIDNGGGWHRSYGNTGWYNGTHGGGFYMTDGTWIRTYGNKSFYHNTGTMRTDGTLQVGGSGGTLNVPNNGNFSYRSNVLFANTAGNVGVGTSSPTYKLHVVGRLRTTGINETSDARLKKDIVPISNALNKVRRMNGVTYNWKTDEFPEMGLNEDIQHGLIAQELEKIIPELVLTDSEGFKSIEYTHLVPVLIEALKEQQNIIDSQKGQISEQASDISDLKVESKQMQKTLNSIMNQLNGYTSIDQ